MGATAPARIFVSWQAAGLHYWPEAGNGLRTYLGAPHRHTFHYRVEIDVRHDDREVEFHDVLMHMRVLTPEEHDWGTQSCEAIARHLCDEVERRWPGRGPVVTVSEDGECGAMTWR
jgi:hypothetical protein